MAIEDPIERDGRIRVFAYGSNLCRERIRARVASAVPTTVAMLSGHELRFHKRGRDGSAKADAHRTGHSRHRVHGVIYAIDAGDKPILDRYEGVGAGYESVQVDVATPAGAIERVWIYLADPRWIDGKLEPFTWYLEYVLIGARQHGLDPSYVAAIETITGVEDPDGQREARERAILQLAYGGLRARVS